jgi:pimeloyl-ACP methyl ester carboxylesterase
MIACQKKTSEGAGEAVVDSVKSADGVTIVYETKGVGAPALVFVHGWCCDRTFWKDQVDFFAEKVQVVTLDLAGHGQSGKNRSDWSIDRFADDVAAVANKLNLQQLVLVGHSMGGPVIAAAEKKLPGKVVGLVGMETFQDLNKQYTKAEIDSILVRLETDFAGTMAQWVRQMLPETADSSLADWIIAKATAMPQDIAVAILKEAPNWNTAELVKDSRIPIVAINSDLWPTNVEGNRTLVPSFELVLMEGLGHYVMLEDPQDFNLNLFDVVRDMAMAGHAKGK